MLSIENLKNYGADTDTGLERCVGNTGLYFRLIGMTLEDANFANLRGALDSKDLKAAFAAAHALKGVVGNLALTPLFDEICNIVEPLRIEDAAFDYESQYTKIMDELDKIKALAE